MARRKDRLFIGTYPTGLVYADKSREKHGDYARCAFLSFSTLELKFEGDCPPDLRKQIEQHAARLQAKRGEEYAVDASGHTVTLGGRQGMREEKPIPYDDDNDPPENDERDTRKIAVYDDEALELMQNWTGGQSDPLYAIVSTGGWNYAWVFTDAIANIDYDLSRVKKLGRNKFQLGHGTFKEADIDELRTIRDALYMALNDPESVLVDEPSGVREAHHVADFNTLDDLIEHARGEGATHIYKGHKSWGDNAEAYLYFPRGDGSYEEARVYRERGYLHVPAQTTRGTVPQLPSVARPIKDPRWSRRTAEDGHRAAEPNDAKDVLDGLGRYLEHEGHDAAKESARIARLIRGARNDRKAEEVLEEVNRLIGGHGVEAIRDENAYDNYYGDTVATYVNMGDTYDATLLFDVREQTFHVTSWGDWYEQYEQRRDAEREEEEPEEEEAPESEDLEESSRSLSWRSSGDGKAFTAKGASGAKFYIQKEGKKWVTTYDAPDGSPGGRFSWSALSDAKRTAASIERDVYSKGLREAPVVRDYIAVDRSDSGYYIVQRRLRNGRVVEFEFDRNEKKEALDEAKRLGAVADPGETVRLITLDNELLWSSAQLNEAVEHSVRDYIAVDRNDRKVAGPFKTRGEAEPHVPAGGYVKFSSARHRRPPPPPSAYPMFREAPYSHPPTKNYRQAQRGARRKRDDARRRAARKAR